jgi:hypothetical protein
MLQLFAPITKINEATREVDVCITSETLDKSKEIFDYESSKPHVKEWSDEIYKATSGVDGISPSLGNVRAMHGKSVAGKLTALTFDDAAKSIGGTIKVVDDNDWAKVTQGAYTGVSIGGEYVRKWDDPTIAGAKRYTAKLSEVSLVDNPCNPGARFVAVRKDGTEEFRKFTSVREVQQFWGCEVPTHRHVAKADALACDGSEQAIKAEAPDLTKSLWSVANLATALASLLGVASDLEWETKYQADDDGGESSDLRAIAQQLFDALSAMVADEKEEQATSPLALATITGHLRKSKTAQQLIKSLRVPSGNGSSITTEEPMEQATKKDAPPPPDPPKPETVEKGDGAALAKALGDLNATIEEMRKDNAKRDENLATLVKYVGALPGPARGQLRAVKKEDDIEHEDETSKAIKKLADLPPEQRAMAVMKMQVAAGPIAMTDEGPVRR